MAKAGRKQEIPAVRYCQICGKEYTSRHKAVRTCGRICGRILHKRNYPTVVRHKPAKAYGEEKLRRIKLVAWLERVKRQSQGKRAEIDLTLLQAAWQEIKEIPLVVAG